MKGHASQTERGRMMLDEPVSRVIPRLAVPTIISMLITAIYNMADTYFVGQISTSASGAVGVIFSAMSIIQALAFTIGMGSGANMSRALGAGNVEEAERFVSMAFFTALIAGVAVALPALLNLDWLVRFLGATETIAPHARAYASYIFYAAPFMMASFAMNNLLRFQGLAFYGMIGMGAGGLLNMALDPLLIFALDLGTAGAAIATAISQIVSFVILLVMINFRSGAIPIRLKNFRPTWSLYGRMVYNGMPSLGRQGIASVATIILNTTARAWGDPAITAMSIVTRFTMFINSTVIGFGQGFQPVCSYCFGAGRYDRVRSAYFFCVKVATVILLALAGAALIFSPQIVTFFRNDPEVIRIGAVALRFQLMTLPLWGVYTMTNMLTQSIGYGAMATVLSISRQGLFLIPLLLVLPLEQVLGLTGLQLCQPLSDVMAAVLAIAIASRVMRRLKAGMSGGSAG